MPSAEVQGRLWGARPQDWAANEEQQTATYRAVLERAGIAAGTTVLDVGCGTGVFLRLASDAGARVAGVDASEALLELARRRVPKADLHLGDLQLLPFDNDRFDVVTGFNSFFFAVDIVTALREAGRVARPGGRVVVQVWGRPDRCDLEAMKEAVAPFLPGASGPRRPPDLWKPGVLEAIALEAGLTPEEAFDASWEYVYPSEAAMLRGLLAAGGLAVIAEEAGDGAVEAAIVEALAPYRTPDGGYRLENQAHILLCSA